MPVELRKRKAPAQPPAPAPASKKSSTGGSVKGRVAKAKAAVKEVFGGGEKAEKPAAATADATGSSSSQAVAVGNTIDLAGFGGEVETNDGVKTTLAKLVEESKAGVVLFTYPKASTPGCTKQVQHFRDSYAPLTATGLSIYGLSTDSPKANTTFKTKQNLPYPLLCDPKATLIKAIGLKKSPSGTQRGVFVVDKSGKVLIAEPGGPEPTMLAVKKLVESSPAAKTEVPPADAGENKKEPEFLEPPLEKEASKEDIEKAATADQVADTAAKLDATPTATPAAATPAATTAAA